MQGQQSGAGASNNLNSEDIRNLVAQATRNRPHHLDLHQRQLERSAIVTLFECLGENEHIVEVNLSSSSLDETSAESIAGHVQSFLENNTTLTRVDLSDNLIGAKAGNVVDAFYHFSHCTSLNLSNNFIREEGINSIADTLSEPPSRSSLRVLDLSDNPIGTHGAREIARALRSGNCPLTRLVLANTQIDAIGARMILDAWPRDRRVDVDFSRNSNMSRTQEQEIEQEIATRQAQFSRSARAAAAPAPGRGGHSR